MNSQQKFHGFEMTPTFAAPSVITSIVVHQEMKRHPIILTCPFCKEIIKTVVKKKNPCLDLVCLLCCYACMRCVKREHFCPSCALYLGTHV